jgi:integrase
MPRLALTDLSLRALNSDARTDFWCPKTPGFGVRVGRNTKTFIVKRGNRRISIGRYPDWSLADARQEAKRLLLEKSAPHRITVTHALDLFAESYLKTRNRHSTARETERILRKGLASIAATRMDAVTKHDINGILRTIRHTPSAANHLFTAARTFFRWAAKNDYLQVSPLAMLSVPHATQARARVLSDQELISVWNTADGTFGNIVRLLILTGQRRTEIGSLRAEYIDHNNRTIVLLASITKNKRTHTFPCGDMAASILAMLPKQGYLFPARGVDGPFNGWSKCKLSFDNAVRDAGHSVTPWTLHDLRRTFATNLAALAVPPHITERLLNQATGNISGVAAIYNRHAYMNEMRAAIALWEERLASLLAQHAPEANLPPNDPP